MFLDRNSSSALGSPDSDETGFMWVYRTLEGHAVCRVIQNKKTKKKTKKKHSNTFWPFYSFQGVILKFHHLSHCIKIVIIKLHFVNPAIPAFALFFFGLQWAPWLKFFYNLVIVCNFDQGPR